jgi:hypothetical protein
MLTLAPTLTGAMRAVMTICLVSFAAPIANAQSAVDERDQVPIAQENTGDLIASDSQIVDYAEYLTSTALSQANSATGSLVNDTDIYGSQVFSDGRSDAVSTIAADEVWSYPIVSVTGQGNGLTVGSDQSDVSVNLLQDANTTTVSAISELRISTYMAHSVQGVSANTNGVEISGTGNPYADIRQFADGTTTAQGVIAAENAEIETIEMAVSASGNAVTMSGADTSATLLAYQSQSGRVDSLATADIDRLDYGGVAASQSVGNTISVTTQYRDSDAQTSQFNSGTIAATTSLFVGDYQYGVANGSSQAIGNSSLVSTIGADANSNAIQNNAGTVTAITALNGGGVGAESGTYTAAGANLSAVAMGNAQSTYVCSECEVGLNSTVIQTNSGTVQANSSFTHRTTPVTSVNSSATAIGNAATFSSQNPGG